MGLVKFAESALLEYDSTTIDIQDYSFQYLKAEKKVREIKNPLISEYYLVELNRHNVQLITSLEGFYTFQKRLLADIFFEIKSDIRWNLYLIFLFEESSLLKDVPTWDIENDDNYARKYFISYSDGLDFFQKDRFFYKQVDNNSISSPLNDWLDILGPIDLTGTLTEKYAKNNINNYLDGNPFLTTEVLTFNNTSPRVPNTNKYKKQIINRIESISLGKFREHCFEENQPLNLSLINLVHGSNGCGKTSIIEAVEFALTGEIKRLKDFKETFNDIPPTSAEALTNAGNVTFKSNRISNEFRDLDKIWYGTPIGREKLTLNSNFNHFNSYNSETAYKFALEESMGENNYSERFSRLIYDDDILSMEKLWKKYRSYLDEELEKRISQYSYTKEQIKVIQNEISEIKQTEDLLDFEKILGHIKFKTNANYIGKQEEIYISLQTIRPVINTFKSNWINKDFKSVEELEHEIIAIETNLDLIQSDFGNKLLEEETIKNDNKNIEKEINEAQTLKLNINQHLKQLETSLKKWEEYKFIMNNEQNVIDYNSLLSEEEVLRQKKDYLSMILNKYSSVMQLS